MLRWLHLYPLKCEWGCVVAALAFILPVKPLLVLSVVFVGIDFITGVWASYRRAKAQKRPWVFESIKAWRTIYKTVFILVGIVLCYSLDKYVLTLDNVDLTKCFTGFACGVEMWSWLENAAYISDFPMFRKLRVLLAKKIDAATGGNIEEELNNTDNNGEN